MARNNICWPSISTRGWKNPGDGLLTLDTVNKREWLDLSETLLSDQFPGTGDSFLEIRESRYQYVVGQTASDGLFEGFNVAKSADVIALAESAGIDTTTFDYAANVAQTLAISSLLGFTFESNSSESVEAMGLLDEIAITRHNYRVGASLEVLSGFRAGLQLGSAHTQAIDFPPGVMLYRTIPEPSGTALVLLGIATVSFRSRFMKPCLT